MVGAFDSVVKLLCFSSTEEALQVAMQEAAATGGVVIEVGRVEIETQSVLFQGDLLRLMAQDRFRDTITELTSIIETSPTGSSILHTTWNNILNPTRSIGYIALNSFGPVRKIAEVKEWSGETGPSDTILCSLSFNRVMFSLPPVAYGVTYCNVCGCKVPIKRTLAVPGVRRCVACQDS